MNYTIHISNEIGPSVTRALADSTCINPMVSNKRDALNLIRKLSADNQNQRFFIRLGESIIASAYRGKCSHYHQY